MGRPQSNGLVELVDERPKSDAKAWHCMDFIKFEFSADDHSWDAYHARYLQAKAGNCPYRDHCPRYARTMAKRGKQPHQLIMF